MTAALVRADAGPGSFGEEVARRVRIVVVAGIPTGVVVAGVGSRLAMLLLRLTSPGSVRGVTSDDGFEIGRVTLGGTYNLLMLGAAVGVIGAVAYRAVAPWLIGPTWFRLLTVGTASGVVVGSMLIHDDGIDFHLLTPTWLAVALFVALPAAFGVAIGTAVDRVAAMDPPPDETTRGRRWIAPVLLVAVFPLVLPVVVVAAFATAVGVLLRRGTDRVGAAPAGVAVVIRGAWLAVAVAGFVALVADVRALS